MLIAYRKRGTLRAPPTMWASYFWFFGTLEPILLLPMLQWWMFGVVLSMSLSFRFLKLNGRVFQVSSLFRSVRAPPASRNKAKRMLGPLIFILRLGSGYLFLLPASKLWDQRNRFKQFFLLHAKIGTISKSKWPTFVQSRECSYFTSTANILGRFTVS